jgi:hypothetical protein
MRLSCRKIRLLAKLCAAVAEKVDPRHGGNAPMALLNSLSASKVDQVDAQNAQDVRRTC